MIMDNIIDEVREILSTFKHSCNGSPGWRRVAFINMTDPSHQCPPGLNITSHPIRTCGSSHHENASCSSTTFNTTGQAYSQVCGRIKAYQYGATRAFTLKDDQSYIDGVSVTHNDTGGKRHIWTFAAGGTENRNTNGNTFFPCDNNQTTSPPPFVGEDYFCESGNPNLGQSITFFSSDPLWDSEGCSSNSTCCQFNSPPWFTTMLPESTSSDIELRLCHFDFTMFADIPIELIELYIK